MNIFEFLGLPADHRPKNKVVQLVKHYNEVPASKKSFPLIGQAKKDGVYGMIVVRADGAMGCFGRTGEQFTSTKKLLDDAWHYLSVGIYIGEILSEHPCSLEQLSGVLNPNRVNALDDEQADIAVGLYIALHDYLHLDEFISGKSSVRYRNRYNRMSIQLRDTPYNEHIITSAMIYDEFSKTEFTRICLEAGEEGAVYKQPEEMWVAGHKGYRSMKDVGEVSYDLECTRVEEGEGKYTGLVANMYFRWEGGSEIKAMPGKGHTHESCRQMWLNPQPAIGKIWKVKGLCKSSLGKVRQPKVEEQRIDKIKGDF